MYTIDKKQEKHQSVWPVLILWIIIPFLLVATLAYVNSVINYTISQTNIVPYHY